jgi:4-hydroxy-4-methyl-2-oxoglutarate aldolase
MRTVISTTQLEPFRRLSTCIVASAIETFDLRLRNTGFVNSSVRCIFGDLPPIVGYAATARIRSSEPPMEGHGYYYRDDWWNHLLSIPTPRVIVIQDVDEPAGLGSFVGDVHANILLALGCIGVVTNGAVRDLPDVRKAGFQMFAGNVSVSHAYAHIFDFGGPVNVGGMEVRPGDLIQGDLHGVQTIPLEIAAQVPEKALEIQKKRDGLISFCHSSDFTVDKLRKMIKEMNG